MTLTELPKNKTVAASWAKRRDVLIKAAGIVSEDFLDIEVAALLQDMVDFYDTGLKLFDTRTQKKWLWE